MKSNNLEIKYIIDEFVRCAIANPEISFSLINEEAEMYNLKSTNLRKRIISVFKKSYEKNLIECHEKYGAISINGFIGKPENTKKTRGEQFIYVNNRFIKSAYLNHAITNSYEGMIEEKKFPFYVLFISINTDLVDVNIHPTKTEIKFEDEKSIYSIIRSSVQKSLGEYNISPSIDFLQENSFNIDINFNQAVEEPKIKVDPNYNPFKKDRNLKTSENIDFEQTTILEEESFEKICLIV